MCVYIYTHMCIYIYISLLVCLLLLLLHSSEECETAVACGYTPKLCTILYHTILCYTIPHHTIPYYAIPYYTIPYHTILYYSGRGFSNCRLPRAKRGTAGVAWPLSSCSVCIFLPCYATLAVFGRGSDTVRNPHRAQSSQFELFETSNSRQPYLSRQYPSPLLCMYTLQVLSPQGISVVPSLP